jgi:hypothetical protein
MASLGALLQKQKAQRQAAVEAETPAICVHETRRLYRVHITEWSGLYDLTEWSCCAECKGQRQAMVKSFRTREMADTAYEAALKALRTITSVTDTRPVQSQ